MSDSLQPHEPQHARLPCPSHSWSLLKFISLSRWCHPTISFSVVPFSSCLQSFPASGSFKMSQLFTSGGQSIGVSASASVLPVNTQDWSPLGWTGWISLRYKRLSRVFSPSPPAPNPSQHQGLFQWVSSSHQVAKVLELQHQSFQWIFRIDFF